MFQIGLCFYLIRCDSLPHKTKGLSSQLNYSHTKNSQSVKKGYTDYSNSVIESQEFEYLLARFEKSAVDSDTNSDGEFDDEFEEEGEFEIYDPWEPMNRMFFSLNDFLFIYGLNPLAYVNALLLPKSIRIGINNFLINLAMPIRMLSSLAQGKFVKAGLEISNFLMNSILGLGGLLNVSRDWFDIHISEEDFGQAFGYWGIPPGPHLEVPFMSAFNLRDAVGFCIDALVSPRSWLISFVLLPNTVLIATTANIGSFTHKVINQVSLRRGEYEELKKNAIDPYSLFKDIYEQHRKKIIEE